MKGNDLLSVSNLSADDILLLISEAVDMKAKGWLSSLGEIPASYSDVPVIDALSDLEPPYQALADLSIYEKKGELERLSLAFIDDGNNVAHSLLLDCPLTGIKFRVASPPGYAVQERILHLAQNYAKDSGAEILCTEEPHPAVNEVDIVYTDVWTSMGQEAEAQERCQVFDNYQVNSGPLSLVKEDAILMHPLPAHRGEEVAEGILDSPQSVVFDQAENRMHLQKALLKQMLGGMERPLATGYH